MNYAQVIMSMNKIVIFTIVASLVVFEITQMSFADDSSENTLFGLWYVVGMIYPQYDNSNSITCYWMRMEKPDGYNPLFKNIVSLVFNGELIKLEGDGSIENSEMHIRYPNRANAAVYTIISYNNMKEMILHDRVTKASYGLISRNLYVSQETLQEFEDLAAKSGGQVVYFAHQNCSYSN